MLEDLTMIATLPVDETAVKKAMDEANKERAAAGETMPPKEQSDDPHGLDADHSVPNQCESDA